MISFEEGSPERRSLAGPCTIFVRVITCQISHEGQNKDKYKQLPHLSEWKVKI
jgi:hypothetical protein